MGKTMASTSCSDIKTNKWRILHGRAEIQNFSSSEIFLVYYIDISVLLENKPLIKFIKSTSRTRVVYFPSKRGGFIDDVILNATFPLKFTGSCQVYFFLWSRTRTGITELTILHDSNAHGTK